MFCTPAEIQRNEKQANRCALENLITCQKESVKEVGVTQLLTVGKGTVGEVADPAVSLAREEPCLKRLVTFDDHVVAGAL